MGHFGRWTGLLTAAALLGATAGMLPARAADEVLHSADFEDGADGWASFGGTTVTTMNQLAYKGDACLVVRGRTDSWQGAALSCDGMLSAGRTYSFTAWVRSPESDNIQLMLKYTENGEAQYKSIGTADSTASWELISASYAIPSGATDLLLYFQAGSKTADFMVDEVSITGEAAWSTQALEQEPLRNIYANYFRIGCAATPSELTTTISREIVKHHFNSLTVGNELKPDYVLDQAGSQANGDNVTPAVSLDAARPVLRFCEDNGIPVRGHVLCWYSQTPPWFFREGFRSDGAFVSKETMNRRLENYIKAVMEAVAGEFPDLDVYCWDVVNECYLNDGSLRPAGEDTDKDESLWSLVYGDDSYIDAAFTYARRYAPEGTRLFYNDFNEYMDKKNVISAKALSLRQQGLIDGIGMQSHLDVEYPDASLYRQAIEKYSELGLEIQITELDITQYDNGGDLSRQTQAYQDIMQVIVDEKKAGANITAVVFWGITDGTSWRKEGQPLLLNADYSCKDSYFAVADRIPESEWGTQAPTQPATEEPTQPVTEDPAQAETEDLLPVDGVYHAARGDVYTDGSVDLLDVVHMQKYLVREVSDIVNADSIPYPKECVADTPWDLDGDNACTVVDLTLLRQSLLS